MAISIIKFPDSNNKSVQDDCWIIVYSDNISHANFKYVFDLKDTNGNIYCRVKIYPNPSNNQGYLNVSSVYKNYFKYDWFRPADSNISGIEHDNVYLNALQDNDYRLNFDCLVEIGEEYEDTTYLNLASVQFKLYNYTYNVFDRFQFNIIDKLFNIPALLVNWVTNRPLNSIKTRYNDELLIGVANSQGGFNGIVVSFDGHTFDTDVWSIEAYPRTQLNISPTRINERIALQGFGYYITETTPYYDIYFKDAFTQSCSPSIRVNMSCNKNKYETIILAFYNALGMFDTAVFNLVSRLSANIERKTFTKSDYTLGSTDVTYFDSNNVYNETKINYGSKTEWTYKLTMDFPTDEEYVWLYELISSPQIYAKLEGKWFPITIKDTNYQYIKYINDNLKALELEIEINQPRYGYRR